MTFNLLFVLLNELDIKILPFSAMFSSGMVSEKVIYKKVNKF